MDDVFFAGDWPAGPKWWMATGGGPGKRRIRLHHRPFEDRPWGGPPFGGPMFGPPRGRGRRRRRRGDVRMAILILLAEEPRNGYQLMHVIEERSDGRWRPSPGSVYPVLSQLEDEGLVRATEREGAKLFELTEAGREQVEAAGTEKPPWEAGEEDEADGLRTLKRLIPEIARAAMQVAHVGSEQQVEQATEELKGVRRTLYRILAEDEDV